MPKEHALSDTGWLSPVTGARLQQSAKHPENDTPRTTICSIVGFSLSVCCDRLG